MEYAYIIECGVMVEEAMREREVVGSNPTAPRLRGSWPVGI